MKSTKQNSSTDFIDDKMQRFAELLLKQMEEMKRSDWKKPWITSNASGVMPQNLNGRQYSGCNVFLLQILAQMNQWELPVFMTFNQIKNEGLSVKKGSESWPVCFWTMSHKTPDGKYISDKEFDKLSEAEQNRCYSRPSFQSWPVFNVSQTNMQTEKPELWQKIKDDLGIGKALESADGMFVCLELDRMFEKQEWVCPINIINSNQAFYSPSKDTITMPMKEQFNTPDNDLITSGQMFYSTALHEMTHSTMPEGRCNREGGKMFGDDKYAKEELVAEMTSALMGASLGFNTHVQNSNISYMQNWMRVLDEQPAFMRTLFNDINRASTYINSHIEKQRIALGVSTPKVEYNQLEGVDLKGSSVQQQGTKFHVRVCNNGDKVGEIPISEKEFKNFRKLSSDEKQAFIEFKVKSKGAHLLKQEVSNNRSLRI